MGMFQTRILVTNSVSILSQTDHIIVLDGGRVTEQGAYTELLSHQGAFAQYIATYLQTADDDEEDEEEIGQWLLWWRPVGQWWRYDMETLSASLALCVGNPSVSGGFPHKCHTCRLTVFVPVVGIVKSSIMIKEMISIDLCMI